MGDLIIDPTLGALNTSLNLREMNQNVITSNITNADTPGYKAKAIEFEQTFRENLGLAGDVQPEKSEPGHMTLRSTDPVDPEIYEVPNDVVGLDGNTVDRAAEMAKLSENQLLYDAAVEMMKRKLGMVKYGITEGGGNR